MSEAIAGHLGLHFAPERLPELQRALAQASPRLGFADVDECARWLLTARPTGAQLDVLAGHLTIGETYFFRDPRAFDILEKDILPRLIYQRRGGDQRLRLWSAGCSSGEEAYSLAILVHKALPDVRDWRVTLLATDINTKALQKAASGVFGEWSFRGVPPAVKDLYFTRTSDRRYAVRDEIKQMVSFERLNLVDDQYPSRATNTTAMDIVLCRNVLMYFTPAQIRKAVGKLGDALATDGWLIVGASETSQDLFAQFATVNFPGVILYQKTDRTRRHAPVPVSFADAQSRVPLMPAFDGPLPHRASGQPSPTATRPAPPVPPPGRSEPVRHAETADALVERQPGTPDRDRLSRLVRDLANQGKLTDALTWCDQWIDTHKLDAAAYYLRAVVLTECGKTDEARRSFHQALYLEPDFVLAHFALGTLARSDGRNNEAQRHFANTLRILDRLQPDDLLPESDGLTARRLTETISTLTGHERRL